ncbi:hypothetical protein CPB85DRAFT_304848 [Mucidula mucida]|nr:hypothetical protein CPB85DRAFT_304848 [Mucidula mucida]
MFAPLVFVVVFVSQLHDVAAQSGATCALASFHWSFNSAEKSPCDVASSLLGVCEGGSYEVQALPEGTHYVGPTINGANACQCSTVTYSLLSACAQCQNRTVTLWSEWSTNCVGASHEKFEEAIPSGVLVPGWAYLDVETSDTFDAAKAQAETQTSPIPSSTAAARASSSVTFSPGSGALGSDNSGSPGKTASLTLSIVFVITLSYTLS